MPAHVLNLSLYPLKENKLSLLTKGLRFIPKPSVITTGHNNEAVARCFSTPAAQVPSLNPYKPGTVTMSLGGD